MPRSHLFSLALLVLTPTAFAQGSQPDRKSDAARHRAMSAMHEEVAVCLESTRPIAECQQIMATQCSAMMGKGGQGMGHGMMGHGKMKGGMMGHGMMGGSMGTMGCPMVDDGKDTPSADPVQPKK